MEKWNKQIPRLLIYAESGNVLSYVSRKIYSPRYLQIQNSDGSGINIYDEKHYQEK